MTNNIVSQFIEVPANKSSIANRRLVYGVGVNDADYFTQHIVNGKRLRCPFYGRWSGILERCYDKKSHDRHPSYKHCTISEEWKIFSNFKLWMKSQDWQGKQIDKDIMLPGNKVYTPESCVFVSAKLNTLLTSADRIRGEYPQGVSFNKPSGKYIANCSVNGIKKYLGIFATIKQAETEYKNFKSKLIIKIAYEQLDPRIREGLLLHAELIAQ